MLIVKKFGGSSVADKERIFNVAKRCIEDYEAGNDVVVVLSAMGKTTDRLIGDGTRHQSESFQERDGYAPGNRRADICCINVHGYAVSGRFCRIFECISGSYAYNISVQQCKIQTN